MKISFTFDNVLTNQECRDLTKRLLDNGHQVWVLTQRERQDERPHLNTDLYTLAKRMGVNGIIFAGSTSKIEKVTEQNIQLHIDDDSEVVKDVNEQTEASSLLYFQGLIETITKLLYDKTEV